MIKTKFFLAVAGCFIFNAAVLFAADYYVSASTGDDANAGTFDKPWKTIGKANNTLRAGDTVYVRAGIYKESIKPVNNGVSGKYIAFEGYQNETALFAGAFGSGASLGNKSYINIKKLSFGTVNDHWIDFEPAGSHNVIEYCDFTAAGTSPAYEGLRITDNANYNVVKNCTFDTPCEPNDLIRIEDANYNLFENNNFGRCAHTAFGLSQTNKGTSSYNVVRNNVFRNTMHNNVGIFSGGVFTLFERNFVYDGGDDCSAADCNSGNPCGSDRDRSAARGVHSGIQMGTINGIFRRNIVVNNGKTSMAAWEDAVGKKTVDCRFYNNTSYKNYNSLLLTTEDGPTTPDVNNIKDNKIINNIFEGAIEYGRQFSGALTAANGDTGNMIFYNNFYDNNIDQEFPVVVSNTGNISQASGFTSAALRNFTLQPASQMIDAGAWLTNITSASGSGASFVVADAKYFMDGWGIIGGDLIQLEGQTQTARITAIDYAANIITVDRSISWQKGQGVSLPYNGSKPDIGAYEYTSQSGSPPPAPWGLIVK